LVVARAVVAPWILARLLVLGSLGITRHVVDQLAVTPRPFQLDQGLLGWDAAWYRDIAAGGYAAVPDAGLRFFPLVPLLGRAIAAVPGVTSGAAMLVVANACALALGWMLYVLAGRERNDDDLARRSAWLVALAPPAFVLVMGYSEATAVVSGIAVFLAVRSQRWYLAALAGYFAGLARPLAVLLVVPALVEAWRAGRPVLPREWIARGVAVVAPLAGLLTYLAWARHRTGDFWYPIRSQEDPTRRGDWVAPWTSLWRAAQDVGSTDRFGSGLHLFSALVFLALLAVLWRRWPASYTAYAGAVLLVALTASNLDSLERYAFAAFPFVLAAADVADTPNRERALFVLAGGALVAASVLVFTGVMVP
jgi:hypothetical protein